MSVHSIQRQAAKGAHPKRGPIFLAALSMFLGFNDTLPLYLLSSVGRQAAFLRDHGGLPTSSPLGAHAPPDRVAHFFEIRKTYFRICKSLLEILVYSRVAL